MTESQKLGRVLSVDPRARRVGWTFFRDGSLEDCRMKFFANGHAFRSNLDGPGSYMIALLDEIRPHALLVPRIRGGGIRPRGMQSAHVIRTVVREAVRRGIAVQVVGSDAVKVAFEEMRGEPIRSKEDIHNEIVDRVPEMTAIAPTSPRRIWEPEPYYAPLFSAVAMYLAWAHRLSKDRHD